MEVEFKRLHPLSILFLLLRQVKGLFIPLLVFLFISGRDGYSMGNIILIGVWLILVIVIPLFLGALQYWFYRYSMGEEGLEVRWGVISRQVRMIPYEKIQNIDTTRTLFHRWFGVADVLVQTASGVEPEAVMQVLSLPQVEELRSLVFERKGALEAKAGSTLEGELGPEREQGFTSEEIEDPSSSRVETGALKSQPAELLYSMDFKDLLVHGLISQRGFALVMAGLGIGFNHFSDRMEQWLNPQRLEQWARGDQWANVIGMEAQKGAGWWMVVAGCLLLLGLILTQFLSLAQSVFGMYGFTLTRQGTHFTMSYGLLTQQAITISLPRIQMMQMETTVLGRWLGLLGIRVKTAGNQEMKQGGGQRSWFMPLVRERELGDRLDSISKSFSLEDLEWMPMHPGTQNRVTRKALIRCLLILSAGWMAAGPWVLWLGPGLLLVAAVWAIKASQSMSVALAEEVIWYRCGWLKRHWFMVPYGKIQSIQLRESPFDRRWGMIGLGLDVANAGASWKSSFYIPYLSADQARELADYLKLQTSVRPYEWA